MAIPSSGLHSNGFSLIRHILKKIKINKLPPEIKNELLIPTKIYVKEINKLNNKKLINGCANITGGGLIENLIRVVPDKLCLNINLSNIKIKPIFKWLKKIKLRILKCLKLLIVELVFAWLQKKKLK